MNNTIKTNPKWEPAWQQFKVVELYVASRFVKSLDIWKIYLHY